MDEYLHRALDHFSGEITVMVPAIKKLEYEEAKTISSLENCLSEFIKFIQSDKRMSFWKYDYLQKKHKWVPSPEQHGQNLLHTFLKSRFGLNIEAKEEVHTGAGRNDIYQIHKMLKNNSRINDVWRRVFGGLCC